MANADILKNMDPGVRILFDAAITTAWMCGEEIGSMEENANAFVNKCLSAEEAELFKSMRLHAFSTGKEVGRRKAKGETPEEISKELDIPLKIVKTEEESKDGSSENDQ